jgi:hypothetical protein
MHVASTTIRKEVYDGYLKFSNEEKIHLLTKDNKKEIVERLEEISGKLGVKLIDYSEDEVREL